MLKAELSGNIPAIFAGDLTQERQALAAERQARAAEGEKKARGTRAGIARDEELDLYLARGCNTLDVEACEGITGKDLFDSLKRMCAHSKSTLKAIGFPA